MLNRVDEIEQQVKDALAAEVTVSHIDMKYMTVAQVTKACKNNKYLLLREGNGYLMGINGRVASIVKRMKPLKDTDETKFIGFIPCGLLEYIEHKHPIS